MRFAFLAYNNMEELDLMGPWEFIAYLKSIGRMDDCFIVAEQPGDLQCAKGLVVRPHYTFENCPEMNCLLVPGGKGSRTELKNPVFLEFLKEKGNACDHVLSVCTGAFLLAAAGFLEGKSATTYWSMLGRLGKFGNIKVLEERFVRDGNIWTSAGVSAGMDLVLAFIKEVLGEEAAEEVQFGTEFYPERTIYGRPEMRKGAPAYLKREIVRRTGAGD
ncbi:MAG: DJ-1/PfpI family protein [Puniceicoccaceae bacterium]